jgi:transcriptional regulator with XRE-family HTH domain
MQVCETVEMTPRQRQAVTDLTVELAALIRERAGRMNLHQADLVRMTGIGQSTVSRIWNAQKPVLLDELILIARALGTTAGEVADAALETVQDL